MINFSPYRDIEFADRKHIRKIQESLLQKHARYCAENSPFYNRLLEKAGVSVDDMTLERLTDIPLTSKEDIGTDNDAFIAAPSERIVDIVFSSGTTGVPTKIAYTEHDLRRLAYNERQSLESTGIGSTDRVLLTCTMDRCFVAGLAYFLGTRSIGAAAVRNGHGTLESHTEIIRRIVPTVVIGVPSFLLKLAVHLDASGIDPVGSSVQKLICIGEPVRGSDLQPLPLGRKLKEIWDADVYSTYASSETVSTFCECTEENGGHLHPELAVVEILDEGGQKVETGETGEVVLTPLAVEGMPLLRFRTGDISFLIEEACACGRRSIRLGPILTRKKQMIKLKGTTLYPQSIALALEEIPVVKEHFLEVSSDNTLSDAVTVHVAVSDSDWDAGRIAELLQSRLRVKPRVIIEPLDVIHNQIFSPRYRKPMRFIDRRES